ncbi:ganglioside GM2 activator-like, partial [Limulus polyphemus]|uniref:Ganglioside GM2 activator-like n=1 Tax=Limulus polyphemus TaxID=6850 RepID=A0ABM1TSN2_LIMPO
ISKRSVREFKWASCGKPSDPLEVKSLNVSPDPIHLSASITLSFDVLLSRNISSFELDLEVKKKILFAWIELPCENNVGSCDYKDVCSLIPNPCPKPIKAHHLPCSCPLPMDAYSLPPSLFHLPQLPLPSWLTSGDYYAKAEGVEGKKRIFCLELYFSLA